MWERKEWERKTQGGENHPGAPAKFRAPPRNPGAPAKSGRPRDIPGAPAKSGRPRDIPGAPAKSGRPREIRAPPRYSRNLCSSHTQIFLVVIFLSHLLLDHFSMGLEKKGMGKEDTGKGENRPGAPAKSGRPRDIPEKSLQIFKSSSFQASLWKLFFSNPIKKWFSSLQKRKESERRE